MQDQNQNHFQRVDKSGDLFDFHQKGKVFVVYIWACVPNTSDFGVNLERALRIQIHSQTLKVSPFDHKKYRYDMICFFLC